MKYSFIELGFNFVRPNARCLAVEAVVKPEVTISRCGWVVIFR